MRLVKTPRIISCLIALAIATLTSSSYAKPLNLYDQPKADAKVVGTIESSNGMVPIFTPEHSEWMKVGDPKNGNVGWINVNDLNDSSGSVATQFSMTQKTIDTKSGPKTVQMVEFSTPKTMSSQQSVALQKEIQTRQDNLQKSIQKMMQDFYRDMSTYYMQNPAVFGSPNMPIVMPIIVYPQQDQQAPAPAVPASKPVLPAIKPGPAKS